eukprot:CAMPEP_0181426030 /NCGR_PEP_ID=MMETSP1110-20121109/15457_1 /TAXON_ID=174948 /ORGANISM="Symbiodinium sp., Strain CCMP421" /LENGTH=698 /DNA_ID=CAMNT_0023549221 /DNA_START=96 /DNA_END=2192 /DNA_ORIENTATION=-
MPDIQELVEQELEEREEEDLLEFISDGEGEDIDTLEEPLRLDESFPSTLIVSGIPQVPKEKFDKLLGVISKLFNKYGDNEKEMPFNAAGTMTEGCVLITYESSDAATQAQQALDGMSLDKKHTFKVVKLDQFNDITNRDEDFRPRRTLASYSRTDFRTWLTDTKCREQFLLRYQTETEIYWHDTTIGEPTLSYGGEREKRTGKIWCDWQVQWSPLGHFLTTFHKQGVALWGGPEFTKKIRFAHDGVKYLEFSPTEEYALTWNGTSALENDTQAVRIHRVLTGESVFNCRTPAVAPLGGDFPHFLWSHDGKYFAECNEASISVRETDTFQLIKDEDGKKRTLKFPELSTFQWSPKDNLLSVWCLEKENNPARLVLVEIPSRRELASRSRTQVEASMHWQSEGDYLCLINTKLSKTKKKGATNLEIFRIREKNIPVDIVEVKDSVRGFHWETKGHRFSLLTSDESGHHPKMFIYGLSKEKCEVLSFFDLPSNSYNNFFWAPEGQYFVCAAVGHGDLLFGGMTSDNKLEILHKDEHFMLTDVQWDPSSRYVITAVTQPMQNEIGGFKYSMEAGFAIWTFQGRVLHRQQKEKLWQISWRPHPPSLLSSSKQANIRKNVKQFSKKYDQLDDQAKEAARNAYRNERDGKMNAFKEILARLDDIRYDKYEETGWGDAFDEFTASKGWSPLQEVSQDVIEVVEEKI